LDRSADQAANEKKKAVWQVLDYGFKQDMKAMADKISALRGSL
jgi:hypothetical protein